MLLKRPLVLANLSSIYPLTLTDPTEMSLTKANAHTLRVLLSCNFELWNTGIHDHTLQCRLVVLSQWGR